MELTNEMKKHPSVQAVRDLIKKRLQDHRKRNDKDTAPAHIRGNIAECKVLIDMLEVKN